MSKEHERKLKRDGEKFESLLEQKEKMIKDWEEKIMQMKVSQKEQIDLIILEYDKEKIDLEQKMADLEMQ